MNKQYIHYNLTKVENSAIAPIKNMNRTTNPPHTPTSWQSKPDTVSTSPVTVEFAPGSIISVVGAGGKTSLLFALARQQRITTLLGTTTKVGRTQIHSADRIMNLYDLPDNPNSLPQPTVNWVLGASSADTANNAKVTAFSDDELERLCNLTKHIGAILILEADGANRRPVKAPAAHEPVIAPRSDVVIGCIGLSILGDPVSDNVVHRLPEFIAVTGAKLNEPLSENHLIRLIRHPHGLFKGTPNGAERIVCLNQVDTPSFRQCGAAITTAVLRQDSSGREITPDRVWLTKLQDSIFLKEFRRSNS